jgi:glycosyltransferase involved in cell wall biosynthesis
MKNNNKTKLAIIGTVGVPANYGGFETLTEHLIEDISDTYDISVYCSGKKYQKEQRKNTYKGARLIYLPFDANGIQSIVYDTISIIHSLFFAEVLLILGVAGAWILPFVKVFTNKKIIISIDGIEWKREKWNLLAKWYLFWAESLAVKYSHIDISDNEAIQDYTSARYGSLSRIIEYGANHAIKVELTEDAISKNTFLLNKYAFKVCRIEPENNVHLILEAFSKINVMPLVIVGNWEKSEYGKALKEKYQTHPNIYLFDPIYNQKDLDVLRSNAALYVHGHSAGGTNPSLVEAMYLGLPILSFGVSYNKVTTENKALYFYGIDSLMKQLSEINYLKLSHIGKNMELIAKRRYTWKNISFKYKLLIEEAILTNKKASSQPDVEKLSYKSLIQLGQAHLTSVINL